MSVAYFYSNNIGLKKQKNEDAIIVKKNSQGYILSVICDGVSSHDNSLFSSNYITKKLSKLWINTKFSSYENMKIWVLEKINHFNDEILDKSIKSNIQMGTTILITVIYDKKIFTANVGDSLSFGIVDRNIELLSSDDSFVGVLLNAGAITEYEASKHPKKHFLTQALGVSENIKIHYKNEIDRFEYIINCSDGLTTMLSKKEIVDIIYKNELKTAVEKLIKLANEKGGVDNISISLFKFLRGVESVK